MNIYMLQQHMGHSSIKVTEMYLAHLTHDEQSQSKGFGMFYTSSLHTANGYGGF
jgi:integrase/recombinase XerD